MIHNMIRFNPLNNLQDNSNFQNNEKSYLSKFLCQAWMTSWTQEEHSLANALIKTDRQKKKSTTNFILQITKQIFTYRENLNKTPLFVSFSTPLFRMVEPNHD